MPFGFGYSLIEYPVLDRMRENGPGIAFDIWASWDRERWYSAPASVSWVLEVVS